MRYEVKATESFWGGVLVCAIVFLIVSRAASGGTETAPDVAKECQPCVELSAVLRQEQQFYELMLKSQSDQTARLEKELSSLHGEIFEMVTNCELNESGAAP